MRTILCLALLLPALALAAPTHAEWQQATGARVQLTFVDGSTMVGTVVDLADEQARIQRDDGSVTFVPMGVVSSIEDAPGTTRTADRPPPPPEPVPVQAPRNKPSVGVGLGVGVGAGPMSVGVGASTGTRTAVGPGPGGAGREWELVGVRYPMRGRETIDWMFETDDGRFRALPEDLLRPKALRDYVFVDQWGRAIPWQTAWAGMGLEGEYVREIKRIDNTMIPLRATETALGIGGIALMIYTYIDASNKGLNPYTRPGWIGGSVMVLGNIGFSLGVTGPTRNRMRVKLGRQGLQRAQEYLAPGQ